MAVSQQPVIVQQLVTASNGEVQTLPVSVPLNTINKKKFTLAYFIVKGLLGNLIGWKTNKKYLGT